MYERFSEQLKQALLAASAEAQALNSDYIDTGHLLLGVLDASEGDDVALPALGGLGISPDTVRDQVLGVSWSAAMPSGRTRRTRSGLPFTPGAKAVLGMALREAVQLGDNHIGTEHLLLGLARAGKGRAGKGRAGKGVAAQVLQSLGADPSTLRGAVIRELHRLGRPSQESNKSQRPRRGVDRPRTRLSWIVETLTGQASRNAMFEKFTDRARRVVVYSQEEARALNHHYIGTEHILLGLIHEGEGVAAKALQELGIGLEAVRQRVEETIGRGQGPEAAAGHIPFTPRAKKVLEQSLVAARQLQHSYIGTEHILLGLINEGEGVAAQVLHQFGADFDRVRQETVRLLDEYQRRNSGASGPTDDPGSGPPA